MRNSAALLPTIRSSVLGALVARPRESVVSWRRDAITPARILAAAMGRGDPPGAHRGETEQSMGLLHRHHEASGTRYRMREKLFAIGDDFWIDTDDERHAFKVNGKALRIRTTFILESPTGDEL